MGVPETRLEGRAIRERWPIPAIARVNILRRLHSILRDEEATNRDKIAATRVLVTADGLNLEQQRIDLLRNAVDPDSMARLLGEAIDRVEHGRPVGEADRTDAG